MLWAQKEDRVSDLSRVGLIQLTFPILLENVLRSTVSLIDVAFLSHVSDRQRGECGQCGWTVHYADHDACILCIIRPLVCINQVLGMKTQPGM